MHAVVEPFEGEQYLYVNGDFITKFRTVEAAKARAIKTLDVLARQAGKVAGRAWRAAR